jgi:branched-chain amino acid transport system ATP-binding protein
VATATGSPGSHGVSGRPPPFLEVRDVSRRFGGVVALDHVSFDVAAGETVGIIGPNGAGKTTLFGVLSGTLAPDGGTVRLDGRTLTGRRPDEIVKIGLARTFQIVRPLPSLTVLANVVVGALGRHRTIPAATHHAREVLRFVELEHRAGDLAGILTLADRKRLEVARALATEPRVLLLDEVMAGLTPREGARAVDLLQAIRARGTTLLVIEHIMRAVMALSDRIVVMVQGRKLAEGTPAEIARSPEVIRAYLGEGIPAHG